jgi:DNA-binding NtrC family response regulator
MPTDHDGHLGNVTPLRRPRVVLAARDPRFRRVTGLLLEHAGYEVATTARLSQLPDLVGEHHASVAVVDGSGSLARAARAVAAVEALYPATSVIVVADGAATPPGVFPVLEKWSFDRLAEAVAAAANGGLRPGVKLGAG